MTTWLIALALAAEPSKPPAPECRVSNGVQVCGFSCVLHPKGAKCAQTPQGVCLVLAGEARCFDPPEEVRWHAEPADPKPTCKANRAQVACGYACEVSHTEVACAKTPWGRCSRRDDAIACWDPTEMAIHAVSRELSSARCVRTTQAFACGWDCKTTDEKAACAQTPQGRCSVHRGEVQCFDAPLPGVGHAELTTRRTTAP